MGDYFGLWLRISTGNSSGFMLGSGPSGQKAYCDFVKTFESGIAPLELPGTAKLGLVDDWRR
jgi:hypothetical protein